MTSAQVGKTEIINNLVGYHIHQDPSPMLVLQPTLDMAQTWSKDRLAPMVRDMPELAERVRDPRSRDAKNTILHKGFPGGHITMAGANSAASLASRPIRIVCLDECDRYPMSAGTEGDPISLAIKRSATFWNRRIIMTSTPTIRGSSKIEAAYQDSDQRHYLVDCPHCHEPNTLNWKDIRWDGDDPYTAHWACPECGGVVFDADKQRLIATGRWQAFAESHGVAGFHLNELYSPWRTWADVVIEFQRAKAVMKTGDYSLMQVWTNTSLGETWEEVGVTVNPLSLYHRREEYTDAPEGVRVVTIGADCQDNRIEWEVIGWGEGEESWGLGYHVLHGDLSKESFWRKAWQHMSRRITRVDGTRLDVGLICIDSGGHWTDSVYEFSRKYGIRKVIPIKGSSIAGKPIATLPRRPNQKRVYLTTLGVDTAKEVIYQRYDIEEPGPGYCHYPKNTQYSDSYFDGATAEKKVKRYVKGMPKYEWHCPKGKPNEPLDCRVYGFAAVRIMQQYFGLDLAKPVKGKPATGSPDEPPKAKPKQESFVRRPQGSWIRR